MNDIVRQKVSRHAKGVLELSNHKIHQAFETLKKEIHEVPYASIETYALSLRDKMDNPSIIVNTNAECKSINSAIKSEILNRDNSGPGLRQRIWSPVHMSKADKMRAGSYESASHIRFARDVGKDFRRGEIYRIANVDHSKGELSLESNGTVKPYRPARHGSGSSFTQVYNQSAITLHTGDMIKFRQSDKKLGVSNNDFGRIESLTHDGVTISFDDKKQITLPKGHRMLGHIDHAWANTTYSFQGVTVKDNIAIMKAHNNPLNTLASLYVGSSRHEQNLAIVTDNKERLLQIISEKLEIDSETIKFIEPPELQASEPRNEYTKALKENHREHSISQDQGMSM